MIFLYLLLAAAVIALLFSLNALWDTLRTGLPFVTTPAWAAAWLENNLQLNQRDIFFELGCGDARVSAALAKKYPSTKFVGIEIQWWPFLLAKWRTRKIVNVKIIRGDIFKHDLSPATYVYGFYITNFVDKLAPYLQKVMRPGTTVVSYGFPLPGWQIDQQIENPTEQTKSRLLFYRR